MSKEFDFLKNVRKWRRMKKKVDKGEKGTVMQYYTPTEIEDLLDSLCTDLETAKTEYGSMKATAEKYQVMYNELNDKKNPPVYPNGPIVLVEYEAPEARHVIIECPDCHNRFYPNDIISNISEENRDIPYFSGRNYYKISDFDYTCPVCGKEMDGYWAAFVETPWEEMRKNLKERKAVTTVTWEDFKF